MSHYIINRVLSTIPVLLGVSVLVFLMLHLAPGDPATLMLTGTEGGASGVSAEDIAALERELGLDRPIWEQYVVWLGNALTGDLGRSIWSKQPVVSMISDQFMATLQLTVAGLGLAILIGLALGVIAAIRSHSWIDTATMTFASLGVSMPGFWLGLVLIFTFSFTLKWFPAMGTQGAKHLILPAIALGTQAAAIIARLVRSSLLEVMRQDYMTTARAKGLRERLVVLRHGLRNALIPVVTVVGLQFGHLLSGSVIIEAVFARQGIGRLLLTAIEGQDFPLVQAIVLFVAVIYVVANLGIDILYGFIDPRIRYG